MLKYISLINNMTSVFRRYFTATTGVDQINWLIGPVEQSTADPVLVQVSLLSNCCGLFPKSDISSIKMSKLKLST
jgi:hypothetical protein